MASQQEVKAKRESVKKLRAELKAAREKQTGNAGERNRQHKLDSLSAEESSLEAELAALRAAAPAPASPPPATPASKPAPADQNNKD